MAPPYLSFREMRPAHYTVRVDSWFMLSAILYGAGDDYFESDDFENGGYNWRLVLHPNGNNIENINDHVSLYLKLSDTNNLPLGWEVLASINFFVHDQDQDRYLCIQDGKIRRFHSMKKQWGISRLLSHVTLNDQSKGYLMNDVCSFGVEVFFPEIEGKGQSVSIVKDPGGGKLSWTLNKFSPLLLQLNTLYWSDVFSAGGFLWSLSLFPSGDYGTSEKGKSLSVYLWLNDNKFTRSKPKVYADFKILVKDQLFGNHKEKTDSYWFDRENRRSRCGFVDFMPLGDLRDLKNGFIVNNTVIVEATINLYSDVKIFA